MVSSQINCFQQWCSIIPEKTGVNLQRIFLIHARLKIKTNQNYISIHYDNDSFTFDVISAIYTTSLLTSGKARYRVTLPGKKN